MDAGSPVRVETEPCAYLRDWKLLCIVMVSRWEKSLIDDNDSDPLQDVVVVRTQ